MLNLKFGFVFDDLYSVSGIERLDAAFLKYLNPEIYQRLALARSGNILDAKKESKLIIDLSWYLEDFIIQLFGIENETAYLSDEMAELSVIYKVKRLFIQRQAAKAFDASFDFADIEEHKNYLISQGINLDSELSFAKKVNHWQMVENTEALEHAKYYAAWAILHTDSLLFRVPKKIDNNNLIEYNKLPNGALETKHFVPRKGFDLTDKGISNIKALDQSNYCINCHNQEKDSCSHGMKDKDGAYKKNEMAVNLAGCPLEEKISEMNFLKSEGSTIGALAVIVIDNPMCAGTGHRICNDCMKACIYQKQEPVDIPAVETKALEHVINLPWGFEIYSLLTRWNPLNFKNYKPKPINNKKILVCGLGPAGYTLSHYLLNEGFAVVAIDGLKIEPLPQELTVLNPIKNIKDIYEKLSTRKAYGFGGVAEYGITVRWDKNYLKIIRLLLERRSNFSMFGGVRFGSTITYENARLLGFDHIALALGAGRPNLLDIENTLVKGVRTASDFLMSLQLTGAARVNTMANLELRMPICVIGGGLTAIDTATESLAYYPLMVEKFLTRYELVGEKLFELLNEEEKVIVQEYISHARQLRENPDKQIDLLKSWGGVKVLYRKSIQDSPAYRLNHEEVSLALEEGIEFVENIVPTEFKTDKFGHVNKVVHSNGSIEARTVFLAIGTQPNTILSQEDQRFKLNGKYFQAIAKDGSMVENEKISKPKNPNVILINQEDGLSVSFFGDLHPSYAGNVVKAMASAKQGYGEVIDLLNAYQPN